MILSLTAIGCGNSGGDGTTDGGANPVDVNGTDNGSNGDTGQNSDAGLSDSGEPNDSATNPNEDGSTPPPTDGGSATNDNGSSVNDTSTNPVDAGSAEEDPFTDLFIQITHPTGRATGMSYSPMVALKGVLFGKVNATSATWTLNDQSGEIVIGDYWVSGPIQLSPGDNAISVNVEGSDGQVSSDEIIIAYNPAFQFDDYVSVRPDQVFRNKSTKLIVSIPIGFYTNFNENTVKLHETDASGNLLQTHGSMKDSGEVGSHCDEIEADGVFSRCVTINSPGAGSRYFRASVDVEAGLSTYTAYSPLTIVEVIDPVTAQTCNAVKDLNNLAKDQYNLAIDNGLDHKEAQEAALAVLSSNSAVSEAGASDDGYGIWLRHDSGILGVVNLTPDGYRGNPGLGNAQGGLVNQKLLESRRALIYAPFRSELANKDESELIADQLESSGCPPFSVIEKTNDKASLKALRELYEFGVLVFATHGASLFDGISQEAVAAYGWENEGAQEIIWSGENVSCGGFSSNNQSCSSDSQCGDGSTCVITESNGSATSVNGVCVDFRQGDLRNGRVAIGTNRYAILPSFIPRYARRVMPNSLIYLGGCRSLYNGSFAASFFAAGAIAVAGYTDQVTENFAFEQGTLMFEKLMERDEDTGEGLNLTGDALGDPIPDPETDGSLRLFGALNLDIMNASLINPSWETGTPSGWDRDGDGRAITKLGCYAPVQGKFMGLISTGMGFTSQTGELSQAFCIPQDKTELAVRWRFLSEEFTEFCGSQFQDTFKATLESADGEMTVEHVWVDSLCHTNECSDCGQHYVGMNEACVSFDVGDVWTTPWREAVVDVSAFAGQGPVTIRLFASDQGDSIYDTVILLDDIRIK
jgi:hypothetical protein